MSVDGPERGRPGSGPGVRSARRAQPGGLPVARWRCALAGPAGGPVAGPAAEGDRAMPGLPRRRAGPAAAPLGLVAS